MKKQIIALALLISTSAFAGSLKSSIPITANIDIKDFFFTGKISYDVELLLNKYSDGTVYAIDIGFEKNLNKTSDKYKDKLKDQFSEYLDYHQLHSKDGLNSKKEIDNVETNDLGRRFIKLAIGKKSIQVVPLQANFSKSRTMLITFNNLRSKKGKRVEKANATLEVKENGKSFDLYLKRKNKKPLLLKEISMNVIITSTYKAKVSLTANNGAIEIIQ